MEPHTPTKNIFGDKFVTISGIILAGLVSVQTNIQEMFPDGAKGIVPIALGFAIASLTAITRR